MGELPIEASLPQLWVERDDDAPRAREVISAYFKGVPTGPPVRCPGCGEENPPAFELCWKCGGGI